MSDTKLAAKVNEASIVRDFLSHPGAEVLRRKIDVETGKAHSAWLLASTADEAEAIRRKAQGFEQFFKFAKEIMIQGDVSRQNLSQKENA